MPPLGEASACSSSPRLSTRQCGVRVAAQSAARSTSCGVPKSRSKAWRVLGRALLEHREDRAAVVVDDHDRQVGPRLVGTEDQPVAVVQERHVAHQREVAGAVRPAERGADRGRDGAVDAGQAAVGDHLAAAADVVRPSPSGRGRGSGSRRRPTSRPPAGTARLTAPATAYGVRPASPASSASSCRDTDASACLPGGEPGRVVGAVDARLDRPRRRPANGRARPPALMSTTSTSSRDSSRVTGRDSVG